MLSEVQYLCDISSIHYFDFKFASVALADRRLELLRSPYSLATAAHSPSGDSAISLTGIVHLTSISSIELVRSEYFVTEPSSVPTRKKSLVAATAR